MRIYFRGFRRQVVDSVHLAVARRVMPGANSAVAELLRRVSALFPESSPLLLVPSSQQFAHHAQRYAGGHAAHWFAATDGQQGDRPFADAHALCSLVESLEAAKIADEIRAEPGGYWVEPHWLAIASDGAGQHIMVDDLDGRVLAVAHDDDHVEVLAPSTVAWLSELLDGYAARTVVWDDVFGLVEAKKLERVNESRREQAARQQQNGVLTTKQKVGLVVAVGLAMASMLLLVWYLETHR